MKPEPPVTRTVDAMVLCLGGDVKGIPEKMGYQCEVAVNKDSIHRG